MVKKVLLAFVIIVLCISGFFYFKYNRRVIVAFKIDTVAIEYSYYEENDEEKKIRVVELSDDQISDIKSWLYDMRDNTYSYGKCNCVQDIAFYLVINGDKRIGIDETWSSYGDRTLKIPEELFFYLYEIYGKDTKEFLNNNLLRLYRWDV